MLSPYQNGVALEFQKNASYKRRFLLKINELWTWFTGEFWNLFTYKRDKGTQNLCFSKEI